MAKDHGSSVNERQAARRLRAKEMSKSRAARIANSADASQGRQGAGERREAQRLEPGHHEGRAWSQGRQEEKRRMIGYG